MSAYHTVKVDGGLYVPLSHWETIKSDRDHWKETAIRLLCEHNNWDRQLAETVAQETYDEVRRDQF